MNKETFLEELRGYLRILEDQEQEDILAEYAQHIDMKLQKGLTEEEAIRDFGPMRELAAGCTCPPEFPVCVCGKKPRLRLVNRKPIISGPAELEENPRARSAKLRVAERTGYPV